VGNDYIALDLDDCIVDGEIAPWAQDILVECDSYAEFSPSGTGIHILMKGKQTNE
jgi:putative DNA primase/helicase